MAESKLKEDKQPVTESILRELSQQDLEWKFFSRELGLSEGIIKEIEEDNRGHSREMKYQALLMWKQTNGNPTIGDLVDALKSNDRLDLVDLIRGLIAESARKQAQKKAVVGKNPRRLTIRSKANQKGRHNLVMGDNAPTDTVLFRDSVHIKGAFPHTRRHTFQYHKRPTETITGVLVEDRWDDDTGGTPKRVEGGPGCTCVEVEVTSQFGRGLQFGFTVYGQKT